MIAHIISHSCAIFLSRQIPVLNTCLSNADKPLILPAPVCLDEVKTSKPDSNPVSCVDSKRLHNVTPLISSYADLTDISECHTAVIQINCLGC